MRVAATVFVLIGCALAMFLADQIGQLHAMLPYGVNW